MSRRLIVDFTKFPVELSTDYGGEIGEIDATTLVVIRQQEMVDDPDLTVYYVLFEESETTSQASRTFSATEDIEIDLWGSLTEGNLITFQLCAEDVTGGKLVKSPVTRLALGESLPETVVWIDDHHDDIIAQIGAFNNRVEAVEEKLDTIEEGAEKNVQADWSQTDPTAEDYIKNKPESMSEVVHLTNPPQYTVDEIKAFRQENKVLMFRDLVLDYISSSNTTVVFRAFSAGDTKQKTYTFSTVEGVNALRIDDAMTIASVAEVNNRAYNTQRVNGVDKTVNEWLTKFDDSLGDISELEEDIAELAEELNKKQEEFIVVDFTPVVTSDLTQGGTFSMTLSEMHEAIANGNYLLLNIVGIGHLNKIQIGTTGTIYWDFFRANAYYTLALRERLGVESVIVTKTPLSTTPDWNENDSSAESYIQNRTHYKALRTELLNPAWDGDFTADTKPTIVQSNTDGDYTYKVYKLSENAENYDASKAQVRWVLYADDTSYEFTNTYLGLIKDYLINVMGLSEDLADAVIEANVDVTEFPQEYIQLGSEDGDAYIAPYGWTYGENFNLDLIKLIYVTVAGTYDVFDDGNAQAYDTGLYVISREIFAPSDEGYEEFAPLGYEEYHTLDAGYLPASLYQKIAQAGIDYAVVTLTANGQTVTSDKTAAEIYELFKNNKLVFFEFPGFFTTPMLCRLASRTPATGTVTGITAQTLPWFDTVDSQNEVTSFTFSVSGTTVTSSTNSTANKAENLQTISNVEKTVNAWLTDLKTNKADNSLTVGQTTQTIAGWIGAIESDLSLLSSQIANLNSDINGVETLIGSGVIDNGN